MFPVVIYVLHAAANNVHDRPTSDRPSRFFTFNTPLPLILDIRACPSIPNLPGHSRYTLRD